MKDLSPRTQSRTTSQRTRQPTTASVSTSVPVKKKRLSKPSFASKLLVIVLIIAALAVTATLAVTTFGKLRITGSIATDKYQAVFLDNGQVYFGKLSHLDSKYVDLTDIYYLQVDQQVQPDRGEKKNTTPKQKISLAKLGNELHGPEDHMHINSDTIVFWENLKNDGKVAKAISEYKANPPKN